MNRCIIRIIENAAGLPCPEAGMYVRSMDFEALAGRGFLTCTAHPAEALEFASPAEALSFYQTTPKNHPRRLWDRRPNRPLTTYTIELVALPATN